MASTYLTRTLGTPTLATKATCSMWFKLAEPEGQNTLIASDSNAAAFYLHSNSTLRIYNVDSSDLTTNRVFRDTSAWYHLVVAIDTTQGTASNRVKVYINGIQETSFSTASYPNQNSASALGNATAHFVGANTGAANYFNGAMSHIHFIDGTAYDASAFGETDATTGEWVGKTSPSVTYGNNGFFILKDGNGITDQSGEGNDFTLGGGTLTDLKDNPDNVFCTWNPLNSYYAGGTFSNGNNTVVLPNKNGAWNTGTLGMTSGKYYWEIKCTGTSNGEELQMGIADKSPIGNASSTAGKAFGFSSNGEYGIYGWNGGFIGNAVANPYTSYGSATSNGIAMFAVDLDNNKFYGGVNGTWFASGNPATGANGKTIQAVADTVDGCYYPAVGTYQGYTGTAEVNFGNGYFGTTAVSSAGTNASEIGIFEYDVPTGYTALSTKGLNE